jgi:hypothetical protein
VAYQPAGVSAHQIEGGLQGLFHRAGFVRRGCHCLEQRELPLFDISHPRSPLGDRLGLETASPFAVHLRSTGSGDTPRPGGFMGRQPCCGPNDSRNKHLALPFVINAMCSK